MKVKVIKKFEIMPDKFLFPSDAILEVMEIHALKGIKQGKLISIDKPELNPVVKTEKVKTKNKKED